jgi:hypothetical protein
MECDGRRPTRYGREQQRHQQPRHHHRDDLAARAKQELVHIVVIGRLDRDERRCTLQPLLEVVQQATTFRSLLRATGGGPRLAENEQLTEALGLD